MTENTRKPAQLVIIRGLPGAGKSTLAKNMAKKFNHYNFEADHFYEHYKLDGSSEYRFDNSLIQYAHYHCMGNVAYFLRRNKDVIVSNTTINHTFVSNYLEMAQRLGVKSVDIVECTSNYGSIRGVPDEVMQRMSRGWRSNEELKSLCSNFELELNFYPYEEYIKLIGL